MENTTWAESEQWEMSSVDPEDQQQNRGSSNDIVGSYHCKSALRCHDSNMKLFIYRKSFTYINSMGGTLPYDEHCLLVLPDLWKSFFHKRYGLDRTFDIHKCREHTTGSPAFSRWSDIILKDINSGSAPCDVLAAESGIFGVDTNSDHILKHLYFPMIQDTGRMSYLVVYLNLCLLVMNFRQNDSRPDINVDLPGIVFLLDEDYREVRYNDHLKIRIYLDGVRIITPIYDQIVQKDIFLNLCDKVNERYNLVIGASIIKNIDTLYGSDNQKDSSDKLLYLTMIKIINWGDDLLYSKMNRAFELIGKYEAYCVSSILLHDDEMIWDKGEFQRNLLEDEMASNPDLYAYARTLCDIFNRLDVQTLAEVHGMWRIWGHPIIDLEGGMVKMEATCTKKKDISERETKIGERTFKSIFCKNYHQKHGHYPLTNLTEDNMYQSYSDHINDKDKEIYETKKSEYSEASYIMKCIRNQKKINDHHVGYRHSDWDNVYLLQSFQIPQSINLATMIKDKAISQTRSELVTSIENRNSVFDPYKRRGVLKWLSEQTFRLKDYLRGVNNDGLKDDDKIIGLYPKERELKVKARFFCLMSYAMRMYITATEEILGKYLLPYFPMITMSDTLLNMIIRLFNMTTQIGVSHSKVVYSMNIDFSKWNQNMREKTNAGIFENIDKIIGFRKLISRTHEIFKTSYLYLCSGEYIPTIIRNMLTTLSPYSRIGDESGKEGLRQKGWTITTVCDIVSLAFMHGVKIELIGGGDNQVLTVEIRSSGRNLDLTKEEQMIKIKNKMNNFRNALAKKMEKRGLPLKLEETWISHRLLMYNKIMYYDGVPLPGRLKVISRLFSNSNDGICTLGNITSTLGTGFQSLSSKDYDPVLSWLMSRILTYINMGHYFLFNPVTGTRRLDKQILLTKQRAKEGKGLFGSENVSYRDTNKIMINFEPDHSLSFEELYIICIYYHKILGGPGIGTPLAYIMKGFPDPLSEAFSFNYYMLGKLRGTKYHKFLSCLTSVSKSPIKHWEHLLEDPVSINHDAPTHGIAALREQAEQVLKSADIKNIQFKNLISIGDTDYLRRFSEKLCSTEQLEPRVLHDIVGSTIPGYVNTILSKVDQSSTLSKLSMTKDIISSIYKSEISYYLYLSQKVKIRKGHPPGDCPTVDARLMRNYTWDREIIGVTTPHPMAFLKSFEHSSTATECDQNYISVVIKRESNSNKITRGPFRPYFGSYTAEKFKTSVLASAYGDEDILKRALKIQKLLGWRYIQGSAMYTIIQDILRCVTDADPNKFLPIEDEITGDVEHRYHDMATKHGGIPANLIKYYTFTSCNTSTFINHSKGAANESLHFQAAIIYCSMMSILDTKQKEKCTSVKHFHEICETCIAPITTPENKEEHLQDMHLLACPGNDLMYISEGDIPVHYHNHISFLRSQNKKDKNLPDNKIMKHFSEPKERESWILLAAVSMYANEVKIKRSAVNLILEAMDISEIITVMSLFMRLHMIMKKSPWSIYDLCDIKDMLEEHEDILSAMLHDPSLILYCGEHGIPISSSKDDMLGTIYDLISLPGAGCVLSKENTVCKYQDPEYQYCKLIILSIIAPSSGKCSVCIEQIYNHVNRGEDMVCKIHGIISPDIDYHMYSLDKLSRYKGASLLSESDMSNDRELALNKKRKNGPGKLYLSIKLAKTNNLKRLKKGRTKNFLFDREGKCEELVEFLMGTWNQTSISQIGQDKSDKLVQDIGIRKQGHDAKAIQGDVSKVINLSQCVYCIVKELHMMDINKKPVERHIKIALECSLKSEDLAIYLRSMLLLNDMLMLHNDIKLDISFVMGKCYDIETVNVTILSELVASYSILTKGRSSIRLNDSGDAIFDTVQQIYDRTPVLKSTELMNFVNRNFYIVTSSDEAYPVLATIETKENFKYKWDLLQPDFTVTGPSSSVLRATLKNSDHQIIDSLLVSAICDNRPKLNIVLCGRLAGTVKTNDGHSLAYSLYCNYVTHSSGITNESLYENASQRLSRGLKEYALMTSSKDVLPWRCSTLVRLILALRILTDVDEDESLKFYSRFYSFSFKRGTYNTVLLHRRNMELNSTEGMINWTPGSMGDILMYTVQELKERLFVTWKTDRAKTRSIDI